MKRAPFAASTSGLSRRQLLRALGVGGAVAPLLPALDGYASTPARPKRLLLVFSSNGMVPERFWPQGKDGADDAYKTPGGWIDRPLAIPAGSDLEPLAPFQQDLVVAANLGRKVVKLGGAHERAMGALWTGCRLNPGSQFGGGGWPSGPSVDQVIARGLPRQADFASIEVGVQPFGPGAKGGTMQHMCYGGSNQPVPSEGNPYKLFDRLFGGAGEGEAAFDRLRAERKSVMDVVRREIAQVQSRIGGQDRQKVDSHLEAVRAIERRLESRPPQSCTIRKPDGKIDLEANENFPPLIKLQTDQLVSAFACDRTRVASLQWSRSFSMVRHTWLGSSEGHHTLSHDSNERPVLGAITHWYNQQLAYLLGELKKVPEGEGTLLDNTLVVYCNELHTGWDHKPGPVPTIVAGQLGGALKTGRYLDYGAGGPFTHSQFLVSLCHVMGLPDIKKVGDLPGPEGPLPGMFA
jgi:hypothetical protein